MTFPDATKENVYISFSDYEKVYLNMSRAFAHLGKEHWGLHCVCSLRFSAHTATEKIIPALRAAWKALLLEYPGLSVTPVGFSKLFVPLCAETIENWTEHTFTVEAKETTDTVIVQSGPRDLPGLYYFPQSQEVLFLSQHWRTDALGTCMILDRLLELLSAMLKHEQIAASMNDASRDNIGAMAAIYDYSLAARTLSPSMEDAAGATEEAFPDLTTYAQEYINRFHAKAVNSGGLPYEGSSTTPPAETAHQEIALSADSTSRVAAACKANGISVSAAVHTALAHTVFYFTVPDSYVRDDKMPQTYVTVMAVNMRDHLPAPYNGPEHACQTYVASITPTVSRSDSFLDAARRLTREYKTWFSERFMDALRWIYKFHAAKLFTQQPKGSPPPKPPSGITLSSLGIVERYLKGAYGDAPGVDGTVTPMLEVDKFRFGVSMMTRQMLLYVWTFRGSLVLSVDYNSAYYKQSMARHVLERVVNGLEQGLGLQVVRNVDS